MDSANLKDYVATIPDFPKKGIMFRDITPILAAPEALNETAERLADFAREVKADVIVAPEARGFFFGIPAAMKEGLPFVPVRKPGKLPREVIKQSYDLEYGQDTLEMHLDGIEPGQRVLIIDDLLATGGTMEAIEKMVKNLGGVPAGYGFIVELDDLHGRERLKSAPVMSMIHYEGE